MKKILCSAMDQGELTRIFTYAMDEAAFRAACAKQCAANPELPHIKTISAVGAYTANFGGMDVDSDRLTKGLIYLARSGVLVDPDFTADVVNFFYGRNYLTEKKSADMVFISYIIARNLWAEWPRTHEYAYFSKSRIESKRTVIESEADPTRKAELLDQTLGAMQCAEHTPECWRKRAAQGGAKIIYTHGGSNEISSWHYKPEFAELIPSPSISADCAIVSSPFDTPSAWSGYAADPAYLKTMKTRFNAANTDLSREAVRAATDLAPAP